MTTDFLIGHIIQFHSVETCLSTRVPHNYLSNTQIGKLILVALGEADKTKNKII